MKIKFFTVLVLLSGLLLYIPQEGSAQHDHSVYTQSASPEAKPQETPKGKEQEPAEPAVVQQAVDEEAPTVEIEPEKQQMIGVRVTEASVRPLRKTIRTVGRIEYDERRLATVNTKFEGWIEKLYVNYTGRPVTKGEQLAEIYSPELYATQLEFINLLKWTNKSTEHRTQSTDNRTQTTDKESDLTQLLSQDAGKLVDAAKQRLKLWDISDEQIEKIRETGKPFRTLTLYSPANGHVIEKMAVEGMRVMPGEKLFDIADLSTLWVLADIFEYELPFVKTGQKAKITLSSFPEKEFESVISFINPSISGATRTATVRFEIPNYKGQLKPQMFTNVEIKVDAGSRLVIPDDAIIDTGKRQIVYVDKGEGYFEPREIMTGAKAGGFTEVLMGVKSGEKVASSATFLIDSEAQLKGVTPIKKVNSEK